MHSLRMCLWERMSHELNYEYKDLKESGENATCWWMKGENMVLTGRVMNTFLTR